MHEEKHEAPGQIQVYDPNAAHTWILSRIQNGVEEIALQLKTMNENLEAISKTLKTGSKNDKRK